MSVVTGTSWRDSEMMWLHETQKSIFVVIEITKIEYSFHLLKCKTTTKRKTFPFVPAEICIWWGIHSNHTTILGMDPPQHVLCVLSYFIFPAPRCTVLLILQKTKVSIRKVTPLIWVHTAWRCLSRVLLSPVTHYLLYCRIAIAFWLSRICSHFSDFQVHILFCTEHTQKHMTFIM